MGRYFLLYTPYYTPYFLGMKKARYIKIYRALMCAVHNLDNYDIAFVAVLVSEMLILRIAYWIPCSLDCDAGGMN